MSNKIAYWTFNLAFATVALAALVFAAGNAMNTPIECEQSEVLTHSGHCWPISDAWMLQTIR